MAKIDSAFYRGLSEELVSKVGRLRYFTAHSSSIGFCHEEIFKNTIQLFLPSRFVVKTGFVFAGENAISKQVDVLIVDENEPSGYFFREGDLVVVPPEAVVCAIEVKIRLDKKHFCLAAENIYSVNKTALPLTCGCHRSTCDPRIILSYPTYRVSNLFPECYPSHLRSSVPGA